MQMTQQGLDRKIGPVILDLNNISLSFGGVKALTDISFDVRQHEIRAIIGPNGAGKSTLLQVLAGIIRPTTELTEAGTASRKQSSGESNEVAVAITRDLLQPVTVLLDKALPAGPWKATLTLRSGRIVRTPRSTRIWAPVP